MVLTGLAIAAGGTWLGVHRLRVSGRANMPTELASESEDAGVEGAGTEGGGAVFEPDEEQASSFRVPSGAPSALSCEEARTVIAQVHEMLAYRPLAVRANVFADSVVDWLDPHGLWSA
ncbi:MAG TPA: hypothetical protein VNO21_23435, partial [Polyangiaceae bacterium]|nr:hypothetical protein [Polyangiaceae bacterium]